jgi:hypothetical protein
LETPFENLGRFSGESLKVLERILEGSQKNLERSKNPPFEVENTTSKHHSLEGLN